MTADVIPFGRGRRDAADDTVRATIKAVMAGRGVTVEQLAAEIDMPASSLYRRFAGRGSKAPFFAGEVAVIADALGVTVAELYGGLDGRFVRPVISQGKSVNGPKPIEHAA